MEYVDIGKKKVGVFTLYHNNTNFGATLQAYALQQKIMEKGYGACVIDFIPDRVSVRNRLFRLMLHPWRIPSVLCRRLKIVRMSDDPVEMEWDKLRERKVDGWRRFCRGHIRATDHVPERSIPGYLKGYDILLTGSDQVWNPTYCSEAHFLPFEKNGRIKLAYAASISRPDLTEEQKDIFRRWLPDFDCITVREDEGKQLLESFLDIKVNVVLDPTLLLTADDWDRIAEPISLENQIEYRQGAIKKQAPDSGYILFAALGTDPSHRDFAARLAERKGMRLVILSTTLAEMKANRDLVGDELVVVSPGQYLTLVRNASLVITDSFHCMAFAINFHRDFYVLKRDADSEVYNMNSRLYTLLGALGLEGQLVDPDDADRVPIQCDLYKGVDAKLSVLRKESEKQLSDMLGLSHNQ